MRRQQQTSSFNLHLNDRRNSSANAQHQQWPSQFHQHTWASPKRKSVITIIVRGSFAALFQNLGGHCTKVLVKSYLFFKKKVSRTRHEIRSGTCQNGWPPIA
ncbi:hypothetical protein MPSEU_000249500 [Mayamaea pseudoterrestris]|nr:hypothetical protein MPSEU_000249500 [Mayamaea pseudoterrestris]